MEVLPTAVAHGLWTPAYFLLSRISRCRTVLLRPACTLLSCLATPLTRDPGSELYHRISSYFTLHRRYAYLHVAWTLLMTQVYKKNMDGRMTRNDCTTACILDYQIMKKPCESKEKIELSD
ncbi:hypothetical protein FPV67DRAFT_458517 [Lyophyllum atratum]|nr:hypothetical protein FPV67DRAFT_458517 [Lyophyllum atratum]